MKEKIHWQVKGEWGKSKGRWNRFDQQVLDPINIPTSLVNDVIIFSTIFTRFHLKLHNHSLYYDYNIPMPYKINS